MATTTNNTALILPGGGARAAYQVGVIKALAELTQDQPSNPFPILCGTSAGALNAVVLAAGPSNFVDAGYRLEQLWLGLDHKHVYRSDWLGIAYNAWRLMLSLVNSGVSVGRPVALLDNLPLKELLRKEIDFSQISRNIQSEYLNAVCVTAMNYTENHSASFFQGGPLHAEWRRWRRMGIPTPLELRHLLASAAIPTIFPPQRIGRNYYGDGALRQLTPLSPAIHLGADKLLVVSAAGHRRTYAKTPRRPHSPALGQVIGHLINSAFIDSLETDIEMLEQVNRITRMVPDKLRNADGGQMRHIDIHVISPSTDIDALAEEHAHELPKSLRVFLSRTGSAKEEGGVNIASYLLFTEPFCHTLIELGYSDAKAQTETLRAFLRQ